MQKLQYPQTAVSPKPEIAGEQQGSNGGQYCNGEQVFSTGDITTVIPETRTVEVPRKGRQPIKHYKHKMSLLQIKICNMICPNVVTY